MVLEYLSLFINYLFLLIMVLISVAFLTLLERKVLSSMQVRLGPKYTGIMGLLQPFSDALKLIGKESSYLNSSNIFSFSVMPFILLLISLCLWLLMPFSFGGIFFSFSVMFFICVSSMSVFPIFVMGWSCNCKYSLLGGLRAVAQMISYEVIILMVFLVFVWINGSFSLSDIMEKQYMSLNFFFLAPLCGMWLMCILAETNRTPYDFAEGESELVSGFNTEYGGGLFSIIFLSEYNGVLFMSFLFLFMFISSSVDIMSGFIGVFFVFWFIWVRGTLPRYRYDKLMYLAWKVLLPGSIFYFFFYLGLFCMVGFLI